MQSLSSPPPPYYRDSSQHCRILMKLHCPTVKHCKKCQPSRYLLAAHARLEFFCIHLTFSPPILLCIFLPSFTSAKCQAVLVFSIKDVGFRLHISVFRWSIISVKVQSEYSDFFDCRIKQPSPFYISLEITLDCFASP